MAFRVTLICKNNFIITNILPIKLGSLNFMKKKNTVIL